MTKINYENYKVYGYLCPHTNKFFHENERSTFVRYVTKIEKTTKNQQHKQTLIEKQKQDLRNVRKAVTNLTDLEHLICSISGIKHPNKKFLYYEYFIALCLSERAPDGVHINWLNKKKPTLKLGCILSIDKSLFSTVCLKNKELTNFGIYFAYKRLQIFADDWSFIQGPWTLFCSYTLRNEEQIEKMLYADNNWAGVSITAPALNRMHSNINNKTFLTDLDKYSQNYWGMTFEQLCSFCSCGIVDEKDILKNPDLILVPNKIAMLELPTSINCEIL